jgi:hypothetical protein
MGTGRKRFESVFQQDGATCHSQSKPYLSRRKVKSLEEPWPAVSCDLSPIEQCWSYLNHLVKRRGPYGVEELQRFAEEEFAKMPQEYIDNLVLSFTSRCEKVIQTKGNVIKP